MGDEVDNHAVSFHDSDVDLFSAGHELEVAIEHLKPWYESFPYLDLLESNHGSLYTRRLKKHGIPIRTLKPLKEILEVPNWKWHNEIILKTKKEDIYLHHGKSGTYNKLVRDIGLSSIQGHFHTKAEVSFIENVGGTRFNMFVGCGVNRDSLAMAYAKNNVPYFALSCGVIDALGRPYVLRMELNKKGRWTKKL